MKHSTLNQRKMLLVAAAGTLGAAVASVSAQPFMVTTHGATLLENLLIADAVTNDYIDVDLNGVARRFNTNQNLAPFVLNSTPPYFTSGGGVTPWWIHDYNAIGSVNGVQELATWGRTFNTVNAADAPRPNIRALDRTTARMNRTTYITNGIQSNAIFNTMNPGGIPVRCLTDGTFAAAYAGDDVPSPGGITNDAAPVDVPTNWAATRAGPADPSRLPGQAGYGNNQIQTLNKNGQVALDECSLPFGHTLAELGTGVVFDPKNPDAADENTIFDTSIAFAPVAALTNFGTGKQTATFTEIRHLFVTGRLPNGENLMAVTRDSGSGTRNAFYSSFCFDPSWGIGENIGTLSTLAAWNKLGPDFSPSSKGGSGAMELTVRNHRLAVGYTGAERAVRQNLINVGRIELLGIRDDINGGLDFVRPTIDAIVNNGYRGQMDPSTGTPYTRDGWRIGGPAVFATFGSPLANTALKGGIGWGETFVDANGNGAYDLGEAFNDTGVRTGDGFAGNGVRDAAPEPFVDTNGNLVHDTGEPFTDIDGNGAYSAHEVRPVDSLPAMRNREAAAFINNITRSTDAFISGFATPFTPGEFLGANFIITGATDYVQDPADPCNWIPNPGLNQSVQDFNMNPANGNVYLNPAFAAFGVGAGSTSRAGQVPVRQIRLLGAAIACGQLPPTENGANITYSDNVSGTGVYNLDTAGASGSISYDAVGLPLRNLVAGDFNGDGRRNWNDAEHMIRAWSQRNGGAAWAAPAASGDLAALAVSLGVANPPGTDASIEVLGDFNGDGNFGRIHNGTTFNADTSDVRYFADGLATDPVSGNLNRAEGFTRVDTAAGTILGNGNFFGTTLAAGASYDAGDSRADVARDTVGSGGTTPGFAPTGADGQVNASDIDYVYAQFKRNPRVTDGALNWTNLNETANSAQFRPDLSGDITGNLVIDQADVDAVVLTILETSFGDVNLDGVADASDLSIAMANLGQPGGWAMGDVNGDGIVNQLDIDIIQDNIGGGCPCNFNGDAFLNSQDFFDFLTCFFGGTCPAGRTADYNEDTFVNSQDFFDFLTCFFAPPAACK